LLNLTKEICFEKCFNVDEKRINRVTDKQAQRTIEKLSKCKNVFEFQLLDEKSIIKLKTMVCQ